jgi:hypothetical protein
MRRITIIEIPGDVPHAYSVTVGLCATCDHLHIVLHDDDGFPFAQCVLSDNLLNELKAYIDEDRRH